MKKNLLYPGFAVLAVLLACQFVRPVKNVASAPGPDDLARKYAMPADVQRVLAKPCYDCHSDHTRYPWYTEVQPVGWWLAHHVDDGRAHLDFSAFGQLDARRAVRQLEQISDEITDGTMPLKSYMWIHADARLTGAEKTLVTAWADELAEQIKNP
jgi:hypothetical protein